MVAIPLNDLLNAGTPVANGLIPYLPPGATVLESIYAGALLPFVSFMLPASEAINLTNGPAWINVWSNSGVAEVRNADAPSEKIAHGWVLSDVAAEANATCYALGIILPGYTSLTPGLPVYLGSSGAPTQTGGNPAQLLGLALSATQLLYQFQQMVGGS